MSPWLMYYSKFGHRSNFLLWVVTLIICGFGSLLMETPKNLRYFDKNIVYKSSYVETFYNNDFQKYLEARGIADQAKRHGLSIGSDEIQKYIHQMKEFRDESGNFSLTVYDQFKRDKKLTDGDIAKFAKHSLLSELLITPYKYLPNIETDLKEAASFFVVEGKQYSINITPPAKEITQQDIRNALQYFIKNECPMFFLPQTRSGIVLLSNSPIEDDFFVNADRYQQYRFTDISLGKDPIGDLLFELNPQYAGKYVKTIISSVKTNVATTLNEAMLDYVKNWVEKTRARDYQLQKCYEISEKYNKGIGGLPLSEPQDFKKGVHSMDEHFLPLLIVPEKCTTVFINNDGEPTILLVTKITKIKQPFPAALLESQFADCLRRLQNNRHGGFIQYWMQHYSERN